MKKGMLFIAVLFSISVMAQSKEEAKIRNLLATQTGDWNRGDIDGFMQTYWQSDSLLFIGKNGVTKGWQATLDRYKKSYPNTAAMGKLSFDILILKPLSPQYYYVVGKWMLQRSVGDISGHFDLLLRKIKNRWVIISDHSS
jgi:ketosteroid isomerase-like protein